MKSALTQYTDLYRGHRAVIDGHAPAALNAPRPAALRVLEDLERWPRENDEGFGAVSLHELFAPDYGINLGRMPMAVDPAQAFACDVPNISRLSALVACDSFVDLPGVQPQLPAGVELMSLARAAEIYPGLVSRQAAPADNPVVALNNLLVQDGVFIRIAAGVSLDKPLQVLSIFNATAPTMAVRRIKIFVEDGASASVLLCEHPRTSGAATLSCRVVEAFLGQGASLHMYDLEEATALSGRASVTAVSQQAQSAVHIVALSLGGGSTRNEYLPAHHGQHCHTTVNGIVIAGGTQRVDNSVTLTHSQAHCSSRQLFKYALFGEARCSFEGLVTVLPGAAHTDARQSNRNLLASPQARMHATPQLIIDCDEVKASHGSATGQLDENALFYMRSRGIPEAEARTMLINAFMSDVLDEIAHEALRERLRCLIEKRLRGTESACQGCQAMHHQHSCHD